MDLCNGPVCHSVRRALPRNGTMTTNRHRGTNDDSLARTLAVKTRAYGAPYRASGLDRSVRPSKLADRAADAKFSMDRNPDQPFTEGSYTKLLTLPCWEIASGDLSGPYYFAEQLGFRKIIDNTFMIATMLNDDPDPEDVRKYFQALKRAQGDIDLRPDRYTHFYKNEFPERFHSIMDTRRWG